VGGAGGEEQLYIPAPGAHMEDYLIPRWLVDLVDFPSGDRLPPLMEHTGHTHGV